jgi:hypothetical protein
VSGLRAPAISADGRWEIYDYGSLGWFVVDRRAGKIATVVAILDPATAADATAVPAVWEQSLAEEMTR